MPSGKKSRGHHDFGWTMYAITVLWCDLRNIQNAKPTESTRTPLEAETAFTRSPNASESFFALLISCTQSVT